MFELLLEAFAVHFNVVVGSIVCAPDEDDSQKSARGPSRPEPEGARNHGEDSIAVLDQHESGLLERLRQGEDEAAQEVLGVGFPKPGEGGRTAGSNLISAADGDEEVIAELPYSVGQGCPYHHLHKAIADG